MPTVDRNKNLTSVQKVQYLETTVTGKAARSTQPLEVTDSNYSIALNVLKETFDYHRRICMRHWELLKHYPKITEETSEAVEDLHEAVKVSLKALDTLGELINSNIVIIDLLSSKLPSSIVRKWQRTLPNRRMPSYIHLMELLQTRANSNDIRTKSNKTNGSSCIFELSRGDAVVRIRATGSRKFPLRLK